MRGVRRKWRRSSGFLTAQDGAVHDTYIGPSITVMRVEATGHALRPLLGVPEVALIDIPPEPDLEAQPMVDTDAGTAPTVVAPPDQAPVIGILDSGVNDHPMLDGLVVGRLSGEGIGDTADVWGHGTGVAGVALFGDLRDAIQARIAEPVGRLAVAKVVGDEGRFPERRTVPRVMDAAIRALHADHGCRLFVLSLGDANANLPRGRVGPWAATLDELARELDVLIVVSAGNRRPRPFGTPASEELVTMYPSYLLEPENRLAEPAGAANVITVGAVAAGTGLDARHERDAHVRPITHEWGEPSPFTRIGPGAGGTRKPDVVDLGGTAVFDAPSARLHGAPHLPAAGVITLNHRHTEGLLTAAGGTSFAAPMLVHKAARLLRRMPNASANLMRALLAGAARSPDAFERRLNGMIPADRVHIGGNGLVDAARAAYSDDHRVVPLRRRRIGDGPVRRLPAAHPARLPHRRGSDDTCVASLRPASPPHAAGLPRDQDGLQAPTGPRRDGGVRALPRTRQKEGGTVSDLQGPIQVRAVARFGRTRGKHAPDGRGDLQA